METNKNKEKIVEEIVDYQKELLKKYPKLDINNIEYLFLDDLKENFDDYSRCEGLWKVMDEEIPGEKLKKIFASLRKTNEMIRPNEFYPYYEEEVFINNLLLGKTVQDMFRVYRIKTDYEKCPLCGSSIIEGQYALSRRDNKSRICSSCGMKESLEDFTNIRE